MTPKERTKELVNKFGEVTAPNEDISAKQMAILCSIIAVDEIIKELEQLRKPEYTTFITVYASESTEGEDMDGYEKIDYWQQVKEEIEKL